jgi:SAM-dependent methyltransferase
MEENYPATYDSYIPHPDQITSPFKRWLVTHGIQQRVRIVMRYVPYGRLLEIGCATGAFLNGMKKQEGWEVAGVEISDQAAAIARQWYHLDVWTGALEQIDFPENSFDVVTLWDVLEHLPDPIGQLHRVKHLLKSGGYLIVRVPNSASLTAKIFGKYWAGWDAPRHLFVFTPDTLRKMLHSAGYELIHQNTRVGGYAAFKLSAFFFLNGAGQTSSRLKLVIRQAIENPITQVLFAPLFFLLGFKLHGPQLLIVAKKCE